MKNYLLIFILMLTSISPLFSQVPVKGIVKSAKGEVLIGVNVILKGTSTGAATDVNGTFTVLVPDSMANPVLSISYMGFDDQEVNVKGKISVEITMDEASQQLTEIVVTGYGTQKKKDLTGAVSVIDGAQLEKVSVIGIDQAMQGHAAGVVVTQNTGQPGDGVSVRIRGTSSIYSSNDPLYVIDGIPTKDATVLTSIPADEIESINILKDASSAAIYGSRANNGVVLITTKKAAKGESKIQVRSQFGIQEHGYLTPMVNTAEYVKIYNEAANNDNPLLTSVAQRSLISDAYAATLPNVNHVEEIFRKAPIQTVDLSISGGKDKTTYVISGSYLDQDGIIFNSGYKRGAARANINSEVKNWLTVNLNLNVSRSQRDIISSSGDDYNAIRYAFFRSPAIPTYTSTGDFTDLPDSSKYFGDGYNPLGVVKNTYNRKNENTYSTKSNIIIKLSKELSFTSNAGIDYNTFNRRNFNKMWGTNDRINTPNSLTVENSYNSSWTVNNVLSYNNTFNDAHSFNVIVGEESVKSETYDQATTIHNFSDQTLDLVYLSNGTGTQLSTETKEGSALQSFFGRVNYDYKGKYLASAIIREDGTSKFAPKNRWGTFYSGSLGWLISKESFLENVTFLDNWKIRVGYGVNGNQDITSYAYTDKLSGQVNYPFSSTVNYGYASSSLGNENVKWETSNQYNVGTDLSFLHGMFTLTVDYFYKVTNDMLVQQPNPPSTGYTSVSGNQWINNGKILNRGIEVGFEFKQHLDNFNFSIGGNIATLHNEVLKMNGVINDESYGFTRTEKGYPIGSFYMYKMEGIFQNKADIIKHASQGTSTLPGDVKYADIDGSNTIDENDRTHVGSPIPTLTGGLTLACDYKGIDFSAFFQGVYGDKIYYEIATDIEGFYRAFPVTERYYSKHWTGDGTSNTQPRASWSASENNTKISSRFLEDGSYLRMKNLQIGYTIPKAFTAKAKIDKVRIYFSGTNLLTLTKYPGLDPEMSTNANADSGQGSDIVRNVDWGTFPSAISYNFGIQLTF